MSLSSAIANAVNAAFVAVGDLKYSVTVTSFNQSVEATRDPITGDVSFTGSTEYTGEIIVTAFTSRENRANVEAGDLRGIMKQAEIESLQISDLVSFDDKEHEVISIDPDPSNTIWDCQLRRKG